MPNNEELQDRFVGAMLGVAIGDAFGYPIELMDYDSICERFERLGCLDLAVSKRSQTALFTDDTQLSLFTADGLLWAQNAGAADGRVAYEEYLFYSYQVWLYTQTKMVAGKEYAWIFDQHQNPYKLRLLKANGLFKKRTADTKNIDALMKIRNCEYGTVRRHLNDNMDNGGIKRVAPVGMYFYANTKKAFEMGCACAAITHGNPVGYISAGCYSALIAELIQGEELDDAVQNVMRLVQTVPDGDICYRTMKYAVELVENSNIEPMEAVRKMGLGYEAYEALAIAIFCALLHRDNTKFAIELAANQDGASDTCASITAAILGAYKGEAAFPKSWVKKLQYKSLIISMAERLCTAVTSTDDFAFDGDDVDDE